MLIHALDPARLCGFAIGEAGERPNQGVVTLRSTKEDRSVACGNLIAYLCDTWDVRKPDLVLFEPPMSIAAKIDQAIRHKKAFGAQSIESAYELSGCIMGVARRFGIRCEFAYRTAVLAKICGKPGERDYADNKLAVLSALKRMRMIDQDCKDDDLADAVAIHVWASGKFARKAPANIGLFR